LAPVSSFVRLSASGLPEQSLPPFLLQLVQSAEHGWVLELLSPAATDDGSAFKWVQQQAP